MLCRRDIAWLPRRVKTQSWTSLWERIVVLMHNGLSLKDLWTIDLANCGQDILHTKEYKEADVIHLHWINQGFISLQTIGQMLRDGKRVVWTMHDEWPLDGIYHYTDSNTPDTALNRRVMEQKRNIYSQGRITFVACSRWLADIARKKPLGQTQEVLSVPNPIDAEAFMPREKAPLRDRFALPRDKKLVLFVSQKVTDKRKGLHYLVEALEHIADSSKASMALGIVGGNADVVSQMLAGKGVETIALGSRSSEEMAMLYAASDCFVTPSLSDNLPNTIMEAMASATPCVGFQVGGIPEMIDHEENGYVAQYCDAADLARGLDYVLADENHNRLALAAREKVMRCYSEEAVAREYLKVYVS